MAAVLCKQNDKLDLLKCIAIYGVVFLHILLPGSIGIAVNCLARMGVPLFFLSSGYFSWNSSCQVLARRVLRTARLLIGACLGLVCLGIALTLKSGGSVTEYLMGRFSLYGLREFLCYQLLPLPYSWPMWFLGTLLLLYLLWWGLTAAFGGKMPYDGLAVMAALLLATHLVLGEVRFLLGGTVNSFPVRNVWQDVVPAFARLMGQGWLMPFVVAALSTLLAVLLYGLSTHKRGRGNPA